MMRGIATFKCPIDDFYDMLQDFRHTAVYDSAWLNGRRIEKRVTENGVAFDVLHFQFKAPFPVTNRDFCLFGVVKKFEDNSFVQVSDSIQHAAVPEEHGFVRGVLRSSGYLARPGENGTTKVFYIVQIDPMGKIPKAIINMTANDRPLSLKAIRSYMEDGAFAASKKDPDYFKKIGSGKK